MKTTSLFWAVVWTVMAALCVLAIFWNPSHFIMLIVSVVMAAMFWHDYRKIKGV